MGKTYKQLPSYSIRHPKGHRRALREKASTEEFTRFRPGSIPPHSWNDIHPDDQAFLPYNVASTMIDRGISPDEVIKKLRAKFKLTHKQASQIVKSVQ